MTKAVDAAVRAAHHVITTEPCMYCFDNPCSDIEGCGCAQAFARAALRAALPAEPPAEMIEAMAFVDADITGDWEWDNFPERDKAIYRKAALASYRALRALLLGEDA